MPNAEAINVARALSAFKKARLGRGEEESGVAYENPNSYMSSSAGRLNVSLKALSSARSQDQAAHREKMALVTCPVPAAFDFRDVPVLEWSA